MPRLALWGVLSNEPYRMVEGWVRIRQVMMCFQRCFRPAGAPRTNASFQSLPARIARVMMYLTPHLWKGTIKKR
jgi:hypothetical protein